MSVWQSLLQPIMAMLSMQSTRNAQVVPLQQPAAPAVLPTAGTKAHCMSSSTQAYADSEGGQFWDLVLAGREVSTYSHFR